MLPNWRSVAGRISKTATIQGRVDETSIKIKKVWLYLYRAVDSEGNTLEFFLRQTRDAEAVTRFFLKALHSTADGSPQAGIVNLGTELNARRKYLHENEQHRSQRQRLLLSA